MTNSEMTAKEAIASLKTLCHTCELFPKCVNDKPECYQAIELAISALQAQELKQEVKKSRCTCCHYENRHWYDWNFCPNCGADMRGDSGLAERREE